VAQSNIDKKLRPERRED
jgi:hypothetical protein